MAGRSTPMRAGLQLAVLLLSLFLPLLGPPTGVVAQSATVRAQIGIAGGKVIQELPLGTGRRALEQRLPLLFRAAEEFGVEINSVSVGRGFWSQDEQLQSENDLDLVVSGLRENVLAYSATLGRAWEQRSVYVWFFRTDAEMLTATVPLPGGAESIGRAVFASLVTELPDGWHVRYAGADSALFVANTGEESDDQFRARVLRAERVLRDSGTSTLAIVARRAELVALTTAAYGDAIVGAVRGKAGVP